jgi:hypothetical protein
MASSGAPLSKTVHLAFAVACTAVVMGHDGHRPVSLTHFTASAPPVAGFGPPHVGQRVVGASLSPPVGKSSTVDQCGAACERVAGCNSFNWATAGSSSSCELNTWGPNYVVGQNASWVYYSRVIERNDTVFNAAVKYLLDVPTRGVELVGNNHTNPFMNAFETNLDYLSQYPVDDVLYWFRIRAGKKNPSGSKNWGWDGHGPDQPYGLKGSVAGLYMMGLGGALRWKNDTELWARLSAVVGNISALQE